MNVSKINRTIQNDKLTIKERVENLVKHQKFTNLKGEILIVNQININYYFEKSFRVDINGVEYWFNDAQLLNFIDN